MRIYIAGAMESVGGNFNFPLFDRWAELLRSKGMEVFNPAEHARDIIGPLESIQRLNKQELKGYIHHVFWDELSWIWWKADAMLLLPGWQRSLGASAEMAVALKKGIEIREAPNIILPTTTYEDATPWTQPLLSHSPGATRD